MSLKRNYLVLLLLISIIVILGWFTYNSTRIITEKTVTSHQQSITAEAAKTAELWLSQHMKIVEAASGAVKGITMTKDSRTLRILRMAMMSGNFSDVYIGLVDGTMIDGSGWPPPEGYDPRIRPWYRRAVEENKTAFTKPYIDLTTGEPVIAIVKPLHVNGNFAGVISADIILDTLEQNVMNVKIGTSGYTFIIDGQGTVLVHPDKQQQLKTKIQESDRTLSRVLDHFRRSDSGSYEYQYEGEEKLLSYQRLSNTDWYLCTTVLKEEARTLAKNTAMLFAMDLVFKALGVLTLLTLLGVGGSALVLFISKQRFESVVKQHKLLLSGKDRDLKGEISRRKDVETRYRTLFDVATNAILISKDSAYIECNEKATAMFGLDLSRIIGKTMLDFSPVNQQDGTESRIKYEKMIDELATGEQLAFEWVFLRSDGTEFPAEVSLRTLRLDSELVTLSSIWDISKRANAEQQLRQAQKMAAMGEMLSSIAHQWRQPLNALSSYVASLQPAYYNSMITKEFIDKLVTRADSQIQFMSRTINDFRQYFRPSKNKEPFDLCDTIRSAVKLLGPQLKQSAVTLSITNPYGERGISVFGFKNEFVHVLVNIISNARDAIEQKHGSQKEGEAERSIDIDISPEEDSVSLSIRDNGGGVPEHLLEKIFTPYFTTKGTATGTGIGLYMAKMIVEKEMQGRITVENHTDGAEFTIHLPVSDHQGEDHA